MPANRAATEESRNSGSILSADLIVVFEGIVNLGLGSSASESEIQSIGPKAPGEGIKSRPLLEILRQILDDDFG